MGRRVYKVFMSHSPLIIKSYYMVAFSFVFSYFPCFSCPDSYWLNKGYSDMVRGRPVHEISVSTSVCIPIYWCSRNVQMIHQRVKKANLTFEIESVLLAPKIWERSYIFYFQTTGSSNRVPSTQGKVNTFFYEPFHKEVNTNHPTNSSLFSQKKNPF
jgi:hypothetical protein